MFAAVSRKACTAFVRVPARFVHIEQRGVPGANLPISIDNPLKLTVAFSLFFGSAFALPYFAVRHQLLKK